MAYSEELADRVRHALRELPRVEEKKMFSGIAFLVNDKMCINVTQNGLMCRIDPEMLDELVENRPCRPMVMRGKELKGYVIVDEEDVPNRKQLQFWIDLCLDHNPQAKSSKAKAAKKEAPKKEASKSEASKKKGSTKKQ